MDKRNAWILTVNPKQADLIKKQEKKYELRINLQMKKGDWCFIYENCPVSAITMVSEVTSVKRYDLGHLWQYTHRANGMSKEEFDTYFQGENFGYALKLNPILLDDIPLGFLEGKIPRMPPRSSQMWPNWIEVITSMETQQKVVFTRR